jgi:threonine dehydratase
MATASSLTIDHVQHAAARIGTLVRQTPVYCSKRLSQLASKGGERRSENEAPNIRVIFKCGNLQTTGSFKFRGATNFMLNQSNEVLKRGVIAFSTGTVLGRLSI